MYRYKYLGRNYQSGKPWSVYYDTHLHVYLMCNVL